MSPRLRRFVGSMLLLAFVLLYAMIAMDVGNLIVATKTKTIQLVYFALAGLGWVPPAGAIVWWMYRNPKKT